MVSNIIRLSLGSLISILTFACVNQANSNIITAKKIVDTCSYYSYDARQIVSRLSCYTCHVKTGVRVNNMLTFSELSTIDSLKILNFAFIQKHNDWFSSSGPYKSAKMDTLSDCEVRSAIRYIKDYNRDTPPMPSH